MKLFNYVIIRKQEYDTLNAISEELIDVKLQSQHLNEAFKNMKDFEAEMCKQIEELTCTNAQLKSRLQHKKICSAQARRERKQQKENKQENKQ